MCVFGGVLFVLLRERNNTVQETCEGCGCFQELFGGFPRKIGEKKIGINFLGRANGAEKASCGEMVVQNAKMDSSNIFSINSKVQVFQEQTLSVREERRNGLSKSTLLDDCFPT